MARYDYYDSARCGGDLQNSGKGSGPRRGGGQRHQKVIAFPVWRKTGCDVYFSSRWEYSETHGDWMMYDLLHTNKSMNGWWQILPCEWVYIGEIPFNMGTKDWDWDGIKSPTWWDIEEKRVQQKKEFQKYLKREHTRKEAQIKKAQGRPVPQSKIWHP